MRGLIEDDAATLRGIEFFGSARAIQEVGELQRINHTQRAEAACTNQLAGADDGLIETVAVADNKMNLTPLSGLNHREAIFHA